MKELRQMYYDSVLNIELYEFTGIRQKFNKHFHQNYVIGYIAAGQRNFICANNQYHIRSGAVLLINPQETHSCEQSSSENLHYFSLNIAPDIMRQINCTLTGKRKFPCFTSSVVYNSHLAELLVAVKNSIINDETADYKQQLFKQLMKQLFVSYASYTSYTKKNLTVKRPEVASLQSMQTIDAICQYLEINFAHSISLAALSDISNLSKYQLLRLFTKAKGVSPHKYLETIRIEKAKQLLEAGLPLVDIAIKSGFTDQSHFTNSFKALIGLTPKMYQRILTASPKKFIKDRR